MTIPLDEFKAQCEECAAAYGLRYHPRYAPETAALLRQAIQVAEELDDARKQAEHWKASDEAWCSVVENALRLAGIDGNIDDVCKVLRERAEAAEAEVSRLLVAYVSRESVGENAIRAEAAETRLAEAERQLTDAEAAGRAFELRAEAAEDEVARRCAAEIAHLRTT